MPVSVVFTLDRITDIGVLRREERRSTAMRFAFDCLAQLPDRLFKLRNELFFTSFPDLITPSLVVTIRRRIGNSGLLRSIPRTHRFPDESVLQEIQLRFG